MGVLEIIVALLRLVSTVASYAKQYQLMKAAEAQALIEALDYANYQLEEAVVAADNSDTINSDPDKLRESDGFRRD